MCHATNLHHLFKIIFHWSHATFMLLSVDIIYIYVHIYIYIYIWIYIIYINIIYIYIYIYKYKGKWTLCRSKSGNICCKQLKTTTTFKSQQTKKTWKIFYNINSKTENDTYLTECIKCNLQYVSKIKTPFKIRLNNYRKNVKDPKAILADKLFQKMVMDLTNMKDLW